MNKENNNLIFGRNPVKEALRSNRVLKVFIVSNFNDKEINLLLQEKKPYIKVVSNAELDSKTNGVHQGIMAEIKPYEYLDLDEIIRRSRKVEVPIVVILDGINEIGINTQNFLYLNVPLYSVAYFLLDRVFFLDSHLRFFAKLYSV